MIHLYTHKCLTGTITKLVGYYNLLHGGFGVSEILFPKENQRMNKQMKLCEVVEHMSFTAQILLSNTPVTGSASSLRTNYMRVRVLSG